MKGKRNTGKPAKNTVLPILLVFLLFLATQTLAEELKIGVGIANIQVNQTQKEQLNLPIVNAVTNTASNVTMTIPMSYFKTGLTNITIKKASFGSRNPKSIKINESGAIKNVTVAGDDITWEANLSAGSATLIFDLLPPTVSSENTTITNANVFEKNFTVSAEESFTNVSITISANTNYHQVWTLWHYNGTDFVDKTGVLHLQVSNGMATFYNVSTSTQLFKLRGITSPTTSAAPVGGEGGGGGGGGGGAAQITVKSFADFEISENLIKEELRGDGIVKKEVTIKNTGTKPLELKIDFSGVRGFIITPGGVSTLEMTLAPGEESSFDIIVFGSGLKKAGVCSGDIILSGDGIEKKINLVLDYESGEPLFDVEINMPERYSKALPGDQVYAEISLFNLKGIDKVDVKVNYSIKDSGGATISSGSTLIAVQTQASFVRGLKLPSTAKPGNYIFSVEAEYEGIIGIGSETFEVVQIQSAEKTFLEMPKILTIGVASLIFLIAALVAISLFDLLANHRVLGPKFIKERAQTLEGLSGEELKRQLELLEGGFESGLISARAYIEDKNRIEGMLKRVKK